MANLEGDMPFGIDQLGLNQKFERRQPESSNATLELPNIVFGRLVNLMRRNKQLSLEQLAQDLDVEVFELVEIEDDVRYSPDPRTVYQIANYFKISRAKLMQISGLCQANDNQLVNGAIRFAARSDPLYVLTREEKIALNEFISTLNDN